MSHRKGRRNNQHHQQGGNHTNHQTTDYESDAPHSNMPPQTQPARPHQSNEEINLSVLRRHNPAVERIISLAPYAVVYVFSPTTKGWEKHGIEGTLFICQLAQGPLGEERYTAFILNRRGLNNFDLPLTDSENVEITEEFVILKADEGTDGEQGASGIADPINPQGHQQGAAADVRIYGLWIYSEPAPSSTAEARTVNAQMIRECAARAAGSLKAARERLEAMRQDGLHVAAAIAETHAPQLEEVQATAPMGRQISLQDLFGQQRAQDDGWSVRAHHIGPAETQHPGGYVGTTPQVSTTLSGTLTSSTQPNADPGRADPTLLAPTTPRSSSIPAAPSSASAGRTGGSLPSSWTGKKRYWSGKLKKN
ncbi:hypothetical protein N7532_007826 [Penicillium argentinense]|uniref:Decapping enzyme Dcp1 n=1 Tax=Penicillium argentinense TaxID=1131581 RepID=A0A9W9EW70_9EURO|nr:uncharacterized protein N7532_007826 [Penicillium argentinense]KAJ5089142.1 hypothetical protein N7532_007826 [Penicillium argentinense]